MLQRHERAMLVIVLTILTMSLAFAAPALAYNGAVLLPCPFVNQAQVDPIVSPGVPSHHLHDFGGGGPVTANTTSDTLRAGGTTCQIKSDRAAYWIPSIIRLDGTPAKPSGFSIYFRAAQAGTATQQITRFPDSFAFVSGNPRNTDKFRSAGSWRCSGASTSSKSIPTSCATGFQLTMAFARCWDGVTLKSSVTPSPYMKGVLADGTCPSTHPVPLPQLTYIVNWGHDAVGGRLSSDAAGAPAGSSLHGDFMNGWLPENLQALIDGCLEVNDPDPSSQSCRFSGNNVVTNPGGVFVTA